MIATTSSSSRFLLLTVCLSALILVFATSTLLAASPSRPGGYRKVEDPTPEMFEIAKWGLSQVANDQEFVRVASIETQVVAGTNLRYTLIAKDTSGNLQQHTIVIHKPLNPTAKLQLLSHQEVAYKP